MEQWDDQGIVLDVRPHGENGAVVSLLTQGYGRHPGYVRGASSSKMRGTLELGSLVDVHWRARTSDQLGSFNVELQKSHVASVMDDPLKLAALQSACSLCHASLPEREKHEGLFHGLLSFFDMLQSDVWGAAYVMWEIALLRELGFSLDLTRCAGGGDAQNLAYVSPKTGRAVSLEAGEIYKEKLLKLPKFLSTLSLHPSPSRERETRLKSDSEFAAVGEGEDILDGLKLTHYFLHHWVFIHHSDGVPEGRQRLQLRFEEQAFKPLEGNTSDIRSSDLESKDKQHAAR